MKKVKTEINYMNSNGFDNYNQMNISNLNSSNSNSNMQSNMLNMNNNYPNDGLNNQLYYQDVKLDPNGLNGVTTTYSSSYYGWQTPFNPNEMSINNSTFYGSNNNLDVKSNIHTSNQFSTNSSPTSASFSSSSSSTSSSSSNSIENTFDKPIKELIQKISHSFRENLYDLHDLIKTEYAQYVNNENQKLISDGKPPIESSTLVEVIEHLKWYGKKYAVFLDHIPGIQSFDANDREELVKSSIHSVILLSLQRKYTSSANYFNCDPVKMEKYMRIFPIFYKANLFMKNIHDKFEKYKLDDKEYALLAALLFVSVGKIILVNSINQKKKIYLIGLTFHR
jgi:hypothetical protein